jgi:hypothetical protein
MMDKVAIPIAKEDVLKSLVQLPDHELQAIIKELEQALAVRRIKPKYVEVKQLDGLVGILSLGGDAMDDTENLYD